MAMFFACDQNGKNIKKNFDAEVFTSVNKHKIPQKLFFFF